LSYTLIVLSALSIYRFDFLLYLPICGTCFFILFLFRREKIAYSESIGAHGEIYLAPIHGRVKSIRQNISMLDGSQIGHEIRVSMSFLNEKGLYLSTSGEVLYLKNNKGRKIGRKSLDHHFYGPLDDVSYTDLIFSSKNNNKTLLRYIDAPYCYRPFIWLKSGDRGRSSSCFGYYPFGGTLLIYLPSGCDVLVYEGEFITPGQSVVAVIKDKK